MQMADDAVVMSSGRNNARVSAGGLGKVHDGGWRRWFDRLDGFAAWSIRQASLASVIISKRGMSEGARVFQVKPVINPHCQHLA
jgi:hypothetical protein